ncbi:calcium-dependent protein kinase 6-like [Maniola hyperantus]|uniref:calcium-dependent protein kinase 6-like n=1 Tax=Aphantopus hyperantus TaxID=2795564 RepID=UPI003748C774
MNKILFLILICKHVIASDEEINEKYIDLLPEEEKQEFLNRIARRILEGIQNNDSPKESHVEITDDQLDAHDAFVKEIIKEESDNLKSEKRRSEKKKVDENDRVEMNNDNFNENNDGGIESNTGDKEEHIDLTLREGKRQKRTNGNNALQKEATTEMSYGVIPVKIVYDQFENSDVKVDNELLLSSLIENSTLDVEHDGNITNVDEEIIMNSEKEQKGDLNHDESVAFVRNFKHSSNLILANNALESDSLKESDNIENSENLRKSFHNKFKLGTAEMVDFELNSNETADYNINDGETTMYNDTWGSTQKIYDNESEEKGDDHEEKTTKGYNTTSNYIIEIMKETTAPSPTVVTEPSINERTNTAENDISLTESTIETTSESISLSTIEKTSPSKPVSEVVNDTQREPKDMEKLERVNFSEKWDSDETVLRARLDNLDESRIDENESIQNVDKDSKKVKVYEVFEVDPNKSHFMTTGKRLQNEHPLYAPVYNYAPENAYFRPYNKFGPNIEEDFDTKDILASNKDEDSKQINLIGAKRRFSGYNNDKNRAYYDTNVRNTNKKQKPTQYYGFMKPVTQNLFNQDYNPDDADYYSSRILRSKSHNANNNYKTYSPESSEEEHPINSIPKSDSIKDYVQAVRNISYLQKLFGLVPQVSEPPIRKTNEYFQKPKKYKLFMDFNRADPEIGTKDELFGSNKSNFKPNTDINIVPLTLNPLYHETASENIPDQQVVEKQDHSESINKEINDLPFKKLFDSMIVVLKDSIKLKNENLVKYNWLKTTVNIQAALRKLLDLIQQLKYGEHIHPKDLELIKYTIYLFKLSKLASQEESMNKNSNRIKDLVLKQSVIKFPKTKKTNKIKEPIKLWKNYAMFLRSEEDEEETIGQKNNLLNDFEDLLENLLFNLNDLHDAIKHISIITEYKKQNWLQDLNFIYLEKGNKTNLAKVILHLSLSRLLDSIEDSSSSVEENFTNFVKKNKKIVKKSKEECLFVLNVLEELRRLNE